MYRCTVNHCKSTIYRCTINNFLSSNKCSKAITHLKTQGLIYLLQFTTCLSITHLLIICFHKMFNYINYFNWAYLQATYTLFCWSLFSLPMDTKLEKNSKHCGLRSIYTWQPVTCMCALGIENALCVQDESCFDNMWQIWWKIVSKQIVTEVSCNKNHG